MGANAFSHCNRIREVTFPATIEYIGAEAFKDCYFNYIVFEGYEVLEVGENAFGGRLPEYLTDVDTPWDGSRELLEGYKALFDPEVFANLTVWRANPASAGVCQTVNAGATYVNGVLTAYEGDVADVSVYSNFDNIEVTALGDGVFKGSQRIHSFYPHHCGWFTAIGKEAFAESSVAYVELFDSITEIGDGAFRDCARLTDVVLPPELTRIGAEVFAGCSGVTELVIPEGVTSIGARAFAGCTGLTELVIPAGVLEIGEGAFDGCTGLEHVLVLCDAALIPDGSFAACADIRMGEDASDEQLAILSAKACRPWYDGVSRVGETGPALTVMPDEPTDASLFEFDAETGTILRYTGTAVDVVIPREIGGVTVRVIGSNAFADCADYTGTNIDNNIDQWVHLRSVVVPETVREIQDRALSYCQQLEAFVCYAPLDTTGKDTFAYCTSLDTVTFVNGVRRIDTNAFYHAGTLRNLSLGDHLQAIGLDAFSQTQAISLYLNAEVLEVSMLRYCDALQELHLGPKVRKAEFLAIMACPSLSEIWYEGAVFDLGDGLVGDVAPAVTVHVRPDATDDEKALAVKRTCIWSDPQVPVTLVEDVCTVDHQEQYLDAIALLGEAPAPVVQAAPATPDAPASPEQPEVPAIAGQADPAYAGMWYGIYVKAGSLEGRSADLGFEHWLLLEEDGTATLTFAVPEVSRWSLDESRGGYVYGDGTDSDQALTLTDEGYLQFGSLMSGYMIFSRSAEDVYVPVMEEAAPPIQQAPAASGGAPFDGGFVGVRFVAAKAETGGVTIDASIIGEYAVRFCDDGSVELTIAGQMIPGLRWAENDGGIDVDYYGTLLRFVPCEEGLRMDFFGSMLLTYVPEV